MKLTLSNNGHTENNIFYPKTWILTLEGDDKNRCKRCEEKPNWICMVRDILLCDEHQKEQHARGIDDRRGIPIHKDRYIIVVESEEKKDWSD